MDLNIEPHPLLRAASFVTAFPAPVGTMGSPVWLVDLLRAEAPAPVQRSEALRAAVRDMLRHGGYKPTGRGKPASEYLLRTAEETGIRSINLTVDACNVVSLHSGFPISVVDLNKVEPPLRIAIAQPGTIYVFNPSGQEMDVSGLVCLHDAQGACANAVKDSQRSKTDDDTVRTLSVVWGCAGFEDELTKARNWYEELLQRAGATIHDVG
ncbi:MAG TPA: phenylalanine--tRNA ligase beta subunit-related protein [Longimicrobiales bacterium]|nr:phenylalanine--tRNA ligase beta subunit-related protein [Longimicrobiales bacterium]